MLLSNHLILFKFKLPLSDKELVVLVFQLLIKLADLSGFALKSAKHVLRLNYWSTPGRLTTDMFV